MPIEITIDWVRKAINSYHTNYKENVQSAGKIVVHAEGKIPTELINSRRPSEPDSIKAYREKIYVPITKNPIQKVINSLEKIRRSEDWNIQYKAEDVPASVIEKETMEQYCEKHYPAHESITNWVFAELLRQYLLDANSWVAIIPDAIPTANEYIKPVAKVFDSSHVISFSEGEYIVLLSYDNSTYNTPAGVKTKTDGKIYYIITDTTVVKYEQNSTIGGLTKTLEYEHGFGELPAFKVGGIFKARKNNETIFESRIYSMVPSLDEAAREYSDLQAEIVQHIHSEKYAYTNADCKTCSGVGKTKDGENKQTVCPDCNGTGTVLNVSPFGIHLIDVAKAGENNAPTPPMGYVQKTSDIAKLQDERVRKHIYDALATLNMEFLSETPLNQSGTAKEVDKDELNNFVNSIAEDLVRIMDRVYYFILEYRYKIIVPDLEKRKGMLPSINVPTKYDLLSSNSLMSEISAAKTSNMNPVIIRSMEIDYAKKKFCTNPEVSYEAKEVFELDPLYGKTQDEKFTMLSNKGITEIDYIISCNIVNFIHRAVEEDKTFYSKTPKDKRAIMAKFADEVKKSNDVSESLKIDVNPITLPANAGN